MTSASFALSGVAVTLASAAFSFFRGRGIGVATFVVAMVVWALTHALAPPSYFAPLVFLLPPTFALCHRLGGGRPRIPAVLAAAVLAGLGLLLAGLMVLGTVGAAPPTAATWPVELSLPPALASYGYWFTSTRPVAHSQ